MNDGYVIDLGSANLRAIFSGQKEIYREPSAVAIHRRTGSIVAVGKEAIAIAPENADLSLSRPFRGGLVANCDITYHVLYDLFRRGSNRDRRGGHLLLSVPAGIAEIEEIALIETAMRIGFTSCHTVYSPIAAMSAEYISPFTHCILIDMGAVRTGIMVLSGGKILYRRTVNVGGESFDRALQEYVSRTYGVLISPRTAEMAKCKAGTVFNDGYTTFPPQKVMGKDMVTGEEVAISLTSNDMYAAFETPMADLLDPICVAVMKIPLAHVTQVLDAGITLFGGCAALHGMDRMIEGVTKVPTTLATSPAEAVVRGMSMMTGDLPDEFPRGLHNLSGFYIENFIQMK